MLFADRNRYSDIITLFMLGIFAVFTVIGSYEAVASKTDLKNMGDIEKDEMITLTLGKGKVISVDDRVSDILVADPDIVDVNALRAGSLYLVGALIGDTNITAIDSDGNVMDTFNIHVTYDLEAIRRLVDDLFPNEEIQVGAIHNKILLQGNVSTPLVASNVSSIVTHYVGNLTNSENPMSDLIANMLEVRGEQQVMLRVKIMEANRRVLKELGITTGFNNLVKNLSEAGATGFFEGPGGLVGSVQGDALSGMARGVVNDAITEISPFFTSMLTADTGSGALGIVDVIIQALEKESLVNILAEPNLTAVSGEEAGFLAGGEFPFPAGRSNTGELKIEFRQFGVSLNFRPVVMSDKRISLKMETEVSALDNDNVLTLDGGFTIPGLDVRRAATTVEMPSGGSMMIAGLLRSQNVAGMSGLPGMKNMPIIGDLMSSKSFERDESELVVLVTPYLVEPSEQAEQARPDNGENTAIAAKKSVAISFREVFAGNMRKIYGDRFPASDDAEYGYIMN